jgi:hypothetical protein
LRRVHCSKLSLPERHSSHFVIACQYRHGSVDPCPPSVCTWASHTLEVQSCLVCLQEPQQPMSHLPHSPPLKHTHITDATSGTWGVDRPLTHQCHVDQASHTPLPAVHVDQQNFQHSLPRLQLKTCHAGCQHKLLLSCFLSAAIGVKRTAVRLQHWARHCAVPAAHH